MKINDDNASYAGYFTLFISALVSLYSVAWDIGQLTSLVQVK